MWVANLTDDKIPPAIHSHQDKLVLFVANDPTPPPADTSTHQGVTLQVDREMSDQEFHDAVMAIPSPPPNCRLRDDGSIEWTGKP